MATKRTPGRVIGEGSAAFSRQSTPRGGKVPKVTVTRSAPPATGVYPGDITAVTEKAVDPDPTGTRVPDWRS